MTSSDLESVRGAMCAAAPVPPTAAQLFKDKAPHPVTFQEGEEEEEEEEEDMREEKEEGVMVY